MTGPMPPREPTVGAPAPPLDLPLLDGGGIGLEGLRGQTVLLTFLRHAG